MRDDPLAPVRGILWGLVGGTLFWAALLGIGFVLMLSGCAGGPTPEPRVETQQVLTPVTKSCVPATMPAAPEYVDTDAALRAAVGPEDRYQLLAAGRTQRIGRLGVVEPVLSACK